MKVAPVLFAAVLCGAMFISSCKKDESTSPTNSPTPTSSSSFKADGTSVTIDSAYAVLYTLGVPPNNREIDVFAFAGGMQVLEFHFLPRTGSQTAAQNFNQAWLTYQTSTADYHSQSGTLALTTCDTVSNRIQGTFNFVGLQSGGTATKTITDGQLLVTRLTRQ